MDTAIEDSPSAASATSESTGAVQRICHGIVNSYLVGEQDSPGGTWALVDAGLPMSASTIEAMAAQRFGPGSRPGAIILTHGHFDHVGALKTLAERWDVPVYAHRLEMPYLTGRSAYPPPDPTVGGGAMSLLSPLYPKGPIDLGSRVQELPADGSVPSMPGWRWIHTPGHAPGHVSLFHESSGALIVGDAFVTTKQESAVAALMHPRIVHGPPKYFTPNWQAAQESVQKLAALRPSIAYAGHGVPMSGEGLTQQLQYLVENFQTYAIPSSGRYVEQPASTDESGVLSVPSEPQTLVPKTVLALGLVAAAAAIMAAVIYQKHEREN